MDLPAEARRHDQGPIELPDTVRKARSRIKPSYAFSTLENAHKTHLLIGPQDFPINVVGGGRLPQEGPNPLGRVRVRPWVS
jgi:hypothetical protein